MGYLQEKAPSAIDFIHLLALQIKIHISKSEK